MPSRFTDSLERHNGSRSASNDAPADQGVLESVLDGILDDLPAGIGRFAADQPDVGQTDADSESEADRFRQQIAAVIDQLSLVRRAQTTQAAELQAAIEQNAAMAQELADQKRETQHWQEVSQQKLVEIGALTARQRELEQTAAAGHQQENDQFRQQITAVIDQLSVVRQDQAVLTAELETAHQQNDALAEQLAEQTRQTQHWQEAAQQKLAEIEQITAQHCEAQQTAATDYRNHTDQLRRQIAELVGQQTTFERDQAAQAAELQTARQQNATLAEQLADQTRQAQHWQETAQQKLAELEQITAQHEETQQSADADHRSQTDELRQQIAELIGQQASFERDQAASAAELQAARQQNTEIAGQLAEQTRQAQHWQESARQKQAEVEQVTALHREAEQTAAADFRKQADQFRQQLAELAGQQALTERDQATQATELQAARQQNAALTEQLAEQTRQTQHWQETAQQNLAEVEQLTARHQDAEQTAAASHRQETEQLRQETDQFRQEIAKLASQSATSASQLEAQAAELQTARQQNAEIAEQLAEQTRQTQHWRETAQQKLAEIEQLAARHQDTEQTTASSHQQEIDQLRQETDHLRQEIAKLASQNALAESQQEAQATELQTARKQSTDIADQVAEQTRQTQHWQQVAGQAQTEIERLRQQVSELIDQQTLAERVPPAELQAALEQNAAMSEQLAVQTRQSQHWQETAQRQLAEIEGSADQRQEASQFRRQIAELIDEQAIVKRAQAAQAAELQTARQQNAAMAEELAEQRLQTQHWQEMASCAKQVTELRTMLERQQASHDTQTRAAIEAAIAKASQVVDLERRVDRREEPATLKPAKSGSGARQTPTGDTTCKPPAEGTPAAKSPEQLAEQQRLTAQSQAQWEQLLRNRSKPQK
jgi:chromosome segregation ATPase